LRQLQPVIDVAAEVRPAAPADATRLAAPLARAFYDDPVTVWANPRERTRLRRSERFFLGRMRALLPHELSHVTRDGTGAAVWSPPDAWQMGLRELLHDLPAFLSLRTPKVLRGMREVERRHPSEPHYYLSVLGVDPPAQGEGIGSALLQPMLRRCDEEAVGAYLETGTERNVRFYSRHGFRVTDEVQMPDGPPMWLMWRDPL
jgi:ribosomal protein S18 acetylase RimI-like enzyme